MKTWRTLLGNERGVALPLAMIMLVVLTMLTLTFMSLGAVEPQISANLADGARARQLAESGIEWGFDQLGGKDFNDPPCWAAARRRAASTVERASRARCWPPARCFRA
jgi:Tfp pilus assembly protein PilX